MRADIALLITTLLLFARSAGAQPLDQSEAYSALIGRYAAAGMLDDPALLPRVRNIAARLIAAAETERAGAVKWPWEVHVTSDPTIAAFCMDGGKMLVGTALVRRLALDDAELAMLLAHEIAHAIAGHRRPRARPSSLDSDPAGEVGASAAAIAQEDEADRIGMRLAHRAGWPLASLVGFFDKLAANEPAGTFSSSHASAAARARQAREYARELLHPASR